MGKIILLDGRSGAGKSHFRRLLEEQIGAKNIKIVTDREPREEEKSGNSDRIFLSKEEYDEANQSGEFIASQQIYGNRYAYRREDIMTLYNSSSIMVLEYNTSNIELFRKLEVQEKDIIVIHIVPQSEELSSRIVSLRVKNSSELQNRIIENVNCMRTLEACASSGFIFYNTYDEKADEDFIANIMEILKTLENERG